MLFHHSLFLMDIIPVNIDRFPSTEWLRVLMYMFTIVCLCLFILACLKHLQCTKVFLMLTWSIIQGASSLKPLWYRGCSVLFCTWQFVFQITLNLKELGDNGVLAGQPGAQRFVIAALCTLSLVS